MNLNNIYLSVFELQEQQVAIKFPLYRHDAYNFRQKQKAHELPNQKTNITII